MNDTSAIFATGMPCADSSTIWARRQVTTDPRASADDPQQPLALVVIDLAYAYSFCHPDRVTATRHPAKEPGRRVTSQQGKRSLLRH